MGHKLLSMGESAGEKRVFRRVDSTIASRKRDRPRPAVIGEDLAT